MFQVVEGKIWNKILIEKVHKKKYENYRRNNSREIFFIQRAKKRKIKNICKKNIMRKFKKRKVVLLK